MPAISCSLYEVQTDESLEDIRPRLDNYRAENPREVYGKTYTLRISVSDVHWESEGEVLSGVLSYETLQSFPQFDGTSTFVPIGTRVMFSLFEADGMTYLTMFSRRSTAEASANRINHILTEGMSVPRDVIFNSRIPQTAIEQFLATHPHTKKWGGWKNLNLNGVNTSSLRGPDIDQYNGTRHFNQHGTKRYFMITLHGLGKTVLIAEQGSVTFYGKMTRQEILDFVRKEIIPLL